MPYEQVEGDPVPDQRVPGRTRFMDAQRVNLDGFAAPDPRLGLVAMASPGDPANWKLDRPTQLVLVGGPAGDDELAGVLTRALPETVIIGRGNLGAALTGDPLGHRHAAALGLALA
jgi:hypothetical protein